MNKTIDALKLAKELDGVVADVEQGEGFDDVCLGTIKYVRDALADHIPDATKMIEQPAQQHDCSRSHPHENMDAMCELRTEIARLTNENARLKARHQDDEINAYRMTLLCIRDGLQQGMSKSIQKLQAREINDVLGLPSFASYRTSPPASKPWVGLTDEERDEIYNTHEPYADLKAVEAKLREKNE